MWTSRGAIVVDVVWTKGSGVDGLRMVIAREVMEQDIYGGA